MGKKPCILPITTLSACSWCQISLGLHQDCKALFLHSKYVELLASKASVQCQSLVAAAIKAQTSATDRNQYKVQFDVDTVNVGFSPTLMDLLGELNIEKLPLSFVGTICFLIYTLIFYLQFVWSWFKKCNFVLILQTSVTHFLSQDKFLHSLIPHFTTFLDPLQSFFLIIQNFYVAPNMH